MEKYEKHVSKCPLCSRMRTMESPKAVRRFARRMHISEAWARAALATAKAVE